MQFDFPEFILIISITVLMTLLGLVSKNSVCLPDLSSWCKTQEIDLGGLCSTAGDALRGR